MNGLQGDEAVFPGPQVMSHDEGKDRVHVGEAGVGCEAADICLTLPMVREACPNELAPTSSTTMQMVLGDALAVALIEARGFSPQNFGILHPGGLLGARLTTLDKVMATGEALPMVSLDATLRSATIEMPTTELTRVLQKAWEAHPPARPHRRRCAYQSNYRGVA